MLTSTPRRRLLQSLGAANYRYQRSGSRTICSSFVGISSTGIHPSNPLLSSSSSPLGISLFSTGAPKGEDSTCKPSNKNTCKDQYRPSSRFEDLNLDPRTLKALRRQGIHRLTEIQEKTYDFIINGHNLVARSRTGTGKTLAFLVPSIERILQSERDNASEISTSINNNNTNINNINNIGIPILIIAPTRELAAQIGKEAEKLLSTHNKHRDSSSNDNKLSSQVIYGGASKQEDVRRFQARLPTILVATPGRLKDHL